jgi:heat shock protein HspQ
MFFLRLVAKVPPISVEKQVMIAKMIASRFIGDTRFLLAFYLTVVVIVDGVFCLNEKQRDRLIRSINRDVNPVRKV